MINLKVKIIFVFVMVFTFLFSFQSENSFDKCIWIKADSMKEKESIDFFQRINQGYLILAEESPERFVCLDGSGSRENIHQKIIENLTIHLSYIPMERKSV